MGMHEVLVTNEGEAVRGAPHFLRSMPKSKKDYDGEFAKNDIVMVIMDNIVNFVSKLSNLKFATSFRY